MPGVKEVVSWLFENHKFLGYVRDYLLVWKSAATPKHSRFEAILVSLRAQGSTGRWQVSYSNHGGVSILVRSPLFWSAMGILLSHVLQLIPPGSPADRFYKSSFIVSYSGGFL